MLTKGNEHPSVTFLKPFYRYCDEGLVNLRFIPKDSTKKIAQKFIPISEIESIPKILNGYIKEYHCCFGIATFLHLTDRPKNCILSGDFTRDGP